MTNRQFNIQTFILDLVICTGTFLIVGIVSIVISIAATGSREDGLGISYFVGLPLITLAFYLIRRQQNTIPTIVQIIISTGLIIGWFELAVRYSDFIPDDQSTLIIFASIPIVLTLIKHSLDRIVDSTPFARTSKNKLKPPTASK
jgi:hypothetical protein